MKYQLEKEAFGDKASLVDRFTPADTSNAKFNIKVRAADWLLIEKLAELTKRSCTFILNDLVESVLERQIQNMAEDDKDSAAVLARHVDEASGTFDCFNGWSAEVFGRNVSFEDDEGLAVFEQDDYWVTFDAGKASPQANDLIRRIKAARK